MRMQPVVFEWLSVSLPETGEIVHAMVPRERYRKIAGRQFQDGEDYPMVVLEARRRESHNAYFAEIADGFRNLPEGISPRWPTATHLRKWCLIETGWCDEKESEWSTQKDAMRYVAFIRDTVDEYARCSVHEIAPGRWKVLERHAKSQSAAAMGKAIFEESKRDVLDMIAAMTGTTRTELTKNAKRSA